MVDDYCEFRHHYLRKRGVLKHLIICLFLTQLFLNLYIFYYTRN